MDGSCSVEKNEQGHDICMITGLCVKMLNFSNEEFVDTVCMGGVSSAFGEDDSLNEEVLDECSKKARLSPKTQPRLATSAVRCSLNKKNRYRSWVYHRVMQPKLLLASNHNRQGGREWTLLGRSAAMKSDTLLGSTPSNRESGPTLESSVAMKSDRIHSLIQIYVSEVLCSPKWEKSMQMEVCLCIAIDWEKICSFCTVQEQKMSLKKKSLFLKAFKVLRADGCMMISMPDAVSMVVSMMGNSRSVLYLLT